MDMILTEELVQARAKLERLSMNTRTIALLFEEDHQ